MSLIFLPLVHLNIFSRFHNNQKELSLFLHFISNSKFWMLNTIYVTNLIKVTRCINGWKKDRALGITKSHSTWLVSRLGSRSSFYARN